MATWALPKAIAIMSQDHKSLGYIYSSDGVVGLGERSVYSPGARIEVEQAKIDSKYVNLRFSYTNRYMHRTSDGSWAIAAVSTTPVEDLSDPLCTLFEPIKVDDNNNDNDDVFYLIHAQSGGRLVASPVLKPPKLPLYVGFDLSSTTQGYLRAVDFDSLVRLPVRGNLAFIGDNAKYLKAFLWANINYFQLSSDIPNDSLSRHQVSEVADGHVRLTSVHWSALWRLTNDGWILGNTTDVNDPKTLFWPIKINANTIALRAADGKFCQRRVTSNPANRSIGTQESSPTKEAELQVEELVTKSLVNNVRYQIEYRRVFDETPHTGWSSTLVNSKAEDVTFSLSYTYEDTKEYTFARSYTLETGVPTFFDAALPFVGPDGSIDEAAAKIDAQLQWNAVNSMTRTVTDKGSIVVPAKSSVVISYIGKRGTCNIPFKYTQVDSVYNAPIGSPPVDVASEGIDGLYTATNLYNFKLVIEKTQTI